MCAVVICWLRVLIYVCCCYMVASCSDICVVLLYGGFVFRYMCGVVICWLRVLIYVCCCYMLASCSDICVVLLYGGFVF